MRLRLLCLGLFLSQLLISPIQSQAEGNSGDPLLFTQTGHTLAYSFRGFWERQGGLPIFGYPLTEVLLENGRPVQYFERARLEWHGEYGKVMAALLGEWAASTEQTNPAFAPVKASLQPNQDYFVETRHSLGGGFRQFWYANGGLATFGFPISEEFNEVNPQDGQTYVVQYFERARFEWHPQAPPQYQVELGQLGRQYLAQLPTIPVAALAPVKDTSASWSVVRPTNISIPRLNLNADIVEGGFSLQGWDVPRYSAVHYWPVGSFPGMAGNIVIAAHSGYKDFLFDRLPQAKLGDIVQVKVGVVEHSYKIFSIAVVSPTATWVMSPTLTEDLTLITCVPIGIFDHRLIVEATPVA